MKHRPALAELSFKNGKVLKMKIHPSYELEGEMKELDDLYVCWQ